MATAATRAASGPKQATAGERKPVHRDFGLSDAEARDMYYKMLVSRVISEHALKLAFQGAIDDLAFSDYTLIFTAVRAGLREGEIAALQWGGHSIRRQRRRR